MKKIFILLIITAFATCTVAQDYKPHWAKNPPKAGNSTYLYVVQEGSGTTPQEAQNNAMMKVYQNTIMRLGYTVTMEDINNSIQRGATWGDINTQYRIPINVACKYTSPRRERGKPYIAFVLCQVAKAGNIIPMFDEYRDCEDKNKSGNGLALLKSTFVPGLGQMGKGHVGKGWGVLLGELALVGGGLTCYGIANQQLDKMKDPATTLTEFGSAKKTYNNCRVTSIVFYSAAAALYVGNLFQAYFIRDKKQGLITFYPALIPTEDDMAAGVGLTYNF